LDALPCNRFVSEPADRALSASLATAPIAFAKDGRHEIDRTALEAGTSVRTAGRDGGHLLCDP
jgi:hypothetical protein